MRGVLDKVLRAEYSCIHEHGLGGCAARLSVMHAGSCRLSSHWVLEPSKCACFETSRCSHRLGVLPHGRPRHQTQVPAQGCREQMRSFDRLISVTDRPVFNKMQISGLAEDYGQQIRSCGTTRVQITAAPSRFVREDEVWKPLAFSMWVRSTRVINNTTLTAQSSPQPSREKGGWKG